MSTRGTTSCWVALLLTVLGCDSGSSGGLNNGESRTLDIAFSPQKTQVWCWAATCEMAFQHYGNSKPQCEIVSQWTGVDCCANPLFCSFAAPSVEFIQQTLLVGGVDSEQALGPLSYEDLRDEINDGNPVMVLYSGSFGGHVVIAFGYNDANNSIHIHDPFYGSFEVPYAISGLYAGAQLWTNTLRMRVVR